MYQGIIFLIRNSSDTEVVDQYDSVEYRFPPGSIITLSKGVAGFFLDRHRDALVLEAESHGTIPEPHDVQVVVRNIDKKPVIEMWDGFQYTWTPGGTVSLDRSIAFQFIAKHPDALRIAESVTQPPNARPLGTASTAASVPEPEPKNESKAALPKTPKPKAKAK